MMHEVYRAPLGYWLRSTLVVAILLLIPFIIVGGIPGFPHVTDSAAKWHSFHAARPYEALVLVFVFSGTVIVFSYFAVRALTALLRPACLRGILEEVDTISGESKRIASLQVSGVRREVRYEKAPFDFLGGQRNVNNTVEIKIGVGDRVVYIDAVTKHQALAKTR